MLLLFSFVVVLLRLFLLVVIIIVDVFIIIFVLFFINHWCLIMQNARKRGATIHSGEREIIRRVIASCDKEASDKVLTVPLAKATERAANYCKVSGITIKRIRKEGKLTPTEEKLKTPGKKRQKADQYKIKLDEFDRRVIVDVIRDFYTVKKIVPTSKKLLPVLNEKINFVWSEWSLRRELKNMGFRWKKCGSKRKILIERPDIVNWRFEYLRKIKNHRLNNKNIFYLDETWIDSNLTFQRCWQSPEVDGVLADMNASNRVIVVDIGSQDGFLKGGRLMYKANCSTGDYHGQMNGVNFEKWIKERVIPNLPDDSVVVIDNAPYHGEQVDKAPSKRATKRFMVDWLQSHGETYEEKTTRKAVLYEAIQRLKPPEKIYKIDNLLKEKGHTVLRLPPYMCDLNSIEFVWAQVKHFVRDNNASGK